MGNVDLALFDLEYEEYDQFYNPDEGGDASQGWDMNPATGQAYEPQIVPRGDYARVLAEFWADGPDSENASATGSPSSTESWTTPTSKPDGWAKATRWPRPVQVCAYFTLGGAMHDAAIAAWSQAMVTITSALCRPSVGCKDADSAPTLRSPTTTSPVFRSSTAS